MIFTVNLIPLFGYHANYVPLTLRKQLPCWANVIFLWTSLFLDTF